MNCLTNNHFSFFLLFLSLLPFSLSFFFPFLSLTLTFVTILSNHLFVAASNLLFISLPVQVGSLIIHNVNKRDSGKFLLLLLRRFKEKIFFERWVKFMQIFFSSFFVLLRHLFTYWNCRVMTLLTYKLKSTKLTILHCDWNCYAKYFPFLLCYRQCYIKINYI